MALNVGSYSLMLADRFFQNLAPDGSFSDGRLMADMLRPNLPWNKTGVWMSRSDQKTSFAKKPLVAKNVELSLHTLVAKLFYCTTLFFRFKSFM
jgi:hypothetical protein